MNKIVSKWLYIRELSREVLDTLNDLLASVANISDNNLEFPFHLLL